VQKWGKMFEKYFYKYVGTFLCKNRANITIRNAQTICAKFCKNQQFLFINSLYKNVGNFLKKTMVNKKYKNAQSCVFGYHVGNR
jgi:hypothetical protein